MAGIGRKTAFYILNNLFADALRPTARAARIL
jgi:hypothetical protein